MIIVKPEAWREMWEHCGTEAPNEACGALLGYPGEVHGVLPMTNVSSAPLVSYDVDPLEMVALYGTVDAVGGPVDVLGFYHSHPRTGPDPSDADLVLAHPGTLYVVCSLVTETVVGFRDGKRVEVQRAE